MLIIEFYVIRIPSIYIEIEEHKCNPSKIIGNYWNFKVGNILQSTYVCTCVILRTCY